MVLYPVGLIITLHVHSTQVSTRLLRRRFYSVVAFFTDISVSPEDVEQRRGLLEIIIAEVVRWEARHPFPRRP